MTFNLHLISGVLIFIGPGRVVYATAAANDHTKGTSESTFYYTFPFSVVPAVLGGIIQIIAAVIIFVIRRDVKRRFEQDRVVLYNIWDMRVDED